MPPDRRVQMRRSLITYALGCENRYVGEAVYMVPMTVFLFLYLFSHASVRRQAKFIHADFVANLQK